MEENTKESKAKETLNNRMGFTLFLLYSRKDNSHSVTVKITQISKFQQQQKKKENKSWTLKVDW